MTVKTSVWLTDEQDGFTRSLVERGRYSSVSAVIQERLDVLRRADDEHKAKIRALQSLIENRRAGPILPLEASVDEFMAAVDRES